MSMNSITSPPLHQDRIPGTRRTRRYTLRPRGGSPCYVRNGTGSPGPPCHEPQRARTTGAGSLASLKGVVQGHRTPTLLGFGPRPVARGVTREECVAHHYGHLPQAKPLRPVLVGVEPCLH